MDCPRFDFHIHTKYLKCANETMEVPAIVRECERLGVTCLAITDHLDTPDQAPLHALIRQDLEQIESEVEIYFGVELNYLGCDGNWACGEDVIEEYGFQVVIGGIHATYVEEYDLRKIVDIQHRHHLATCRDPLVHVLVHPYWFGWREFDQGGWPWFDSMKGVPEAYARELGQASRDTGTAIEINGSSVIDCAGYYPPSFVEEYLDYLAILAAEGALFTVGSDAHDIGKLASVERTWQAFDRLGIPPERLWRPEAAPAFGGDE